MYDIVSKQLLCNCLSTFEKYDDLVEAVATYVFVWSKNIMKHGKGHSFHGINC